MINKSLMGGTACSAIQDTELTVANRTERVLLYGAQVLNPLEIRSYSNIQGWNNNKMSYTVSLKNLICICGGDFFTN